MQELMKRFGSFLDIARGPRGEERFHSARQQRRLTDLVRECLSFFTPWDTYCLVPAGVNPIVDGIADFSSRSKQDEDKIEVDRIHAVLHPDCYSRLIKLLGFDPPDRRLETPHFFLSMDNNNSGEGSGGKRRNPSNLSNNELDEIKGHLDDQSARRKRVAVGMLRIMVDGKEHARLGPSRTGAARIEIDNDVELIEVRSIVNGDDLLLASHLFTDRESAIHQKADVTSIVLEGGQKIAITVTPTQDSSKAIVDVAYRETGLFRLASLYLNRISPSSSVDGQSVTGRWRPAFVLGLTLLLLSVIGVFRFVLNRNSGSSQPETTAINRQVDKPSGVTTPATTMNTEVPDKTGNASSSSNTPMGKDERRNLESKGTVQPSSIESANTVESKGTEPRLRESRKSESMAGNSEPNETRSSTSERNTPESDTTRSVSNALAVVPLAEVRRIYVEVHGNDVLGTTLRERTIASLSKSNRFSAVSTKDDAEALLRITIKSANKITAKIVVRAALINARGEEIWHGASSRGIFEGSTESVAVDIVNGLLDDVRTINRRH